MKLKQPKVKQPKPLRPTKSSFLEFVQTTDDLWFVAEDTLDSFTSEVTYEADLFHPVKKQGSIDAYPRTLGIAGVWFADGKGNQIGLYEDQQMIGFRCHNHGGAFVLATKRKEIV